MIRTSLGHKSAAIVTPAIQTLTNLGSASSSSVTSCISGAGLADALSALLHPPRKSVGDAASTALKRLHAGNKKGCRR